MVGFISSRSKILAIAKGGLGPTEKATVSPATILELIGLIVSDVILLRILTT